MNFKRKGKVTAGAPINMKIIRAKQAIVLKLSHSFAFAFIKLTRFTSRSIQHDTPSHFKLAFSLDTVVINRSSVSYSAENFLVRILSL